MISVGSIQGGINNIIPDEVELWGTIRTFDPEMRAQIHREVEQVATSIAAAAGASAEFVRTGTAYPVTINDPELTAASVPLIDQVLGAERVAFSELINGEPRISRSSRGGYPGFIFSWARPRSGSTTGARQRTIRRCSSPTRGCCRSGSS